MERSLVAGQWGGEAPRALDHVTANVGRITGGTSINLVADSCEAEIDIRLPVGLPTAQGMETLLGLLRRSKTNAELLKTA